MGQCQKKEQTTQRNGGSRNPYRPLMCIRYIGMLLLIRLFESCCGITSKNEKKYKSLMDANNDWKSIHYVIVLLTVVPTTTTIPIMPPPCYYYYTKRDHDCIIWWQPIHRNNRTRMQPCSTSYLLLCTEQQKRYYNNHLVLYYYYSYCLLVDSTGSIKRHSSLIVSKVISYIFTPVTMQQQASIFWSKEYTS